jgi:O-antigen/teichoic acid export membrane protein
MLGRVLALVSSVVVARYIGKQGYGQIGIIQSTVQMFGVLVGLGMGLTATRYVAEMRRTQPERVGRILGMGNLVSWGSGAMMGVVMFLAAGWLATNTLKKPELTGMLQIGAVLLVLGGLDGAQNGALSGFEAFKTRAQISLAAGVANLPIMILGVMLDGPRGGVVALTITAGLTCLLNFLALRRELRTNGIHVDYSGFRSEQSLLWKFSVPAVLSGLVWAPFVWGANVLLVRQPQGLSEMGIYNAASSWQQLLSFVPSILASVALPIFSSAMSSGGGVKDFHKTAQMSQSISVVVAFPLCAALMFGADFIMALYGKGFAEGTPAIIGVLLTGLILAIGATNAPALQAKGKMWVAVFYNLVWGVLFLVLTFLLVGKFGAAAIPFSTAISHTLCGIYGFYYVRHDISQDLQGRAYLSMAAALALAIGALLLPREVKVWLAIPISFVSFFIALMFLSDPSWRNSVFRWLRGTMAMRLRV